MPVARVDRSVRLGCSGSRRHRGRTPPSAGRSRRAATRTRPAWACRTAWPTSAVAMPCRYVRGRPWYRAGRHDRFRPGHVDKSGQAAAAGGRSPSPGCKAGSGPTTQASARPPCAVIRVIISASLTGPRQRYSIDGDTRRIVGHAAIGVNTDQPGHDPEHARNDPRCERWHKAASRRSTTHVRQRATAAPGAVSAGSNPAGGTGHWRALTMIRHGLPGQRSGISSSGRKPMRA